MASSAPSSAPPAGQQKSREPIAVAAAKHSAKKRTTTDDAILRATKALFRTSFAAPSWQARPRHQNGLANHYRL